MNPGKLDRLLTLQKRVVTKDDTNTDVVTWQTVGRPWAELINTRGTEGTIADAERSQSVRQFRIRYREGLTSDGFRIVYKGQAFDIRGIIPEGRQSGLLLDTVSTLAIA